MREILYIIAGYLAGSMLFAKISSRLLGCGDVTEKSKDKNPGTSNAFRNGGFLCGVFTLCGDIFKGFFPVWLYLHMGNGHIGNPAFALILAAPVIGHIFPVFYHFHGGKGIATTFGCLLGILPEFQAVLVLAVCFIFFSCIIRIEPNYYRTVFTYFCTWILDLFIIKKKMILAGFTLIALSVGYRLWTSGEEKDSCKVRFLWRH